MAGNVKSDKSGEGLKIGLYIEDDVLRAGLASLLSQISSMVEIIPPDDFSRHRPVGPAVSLDVFVVTSSNRFHGSKDVGWGGFSAPRVLMILEEPELGSEVDLFSDYPADSYLMRTGLTVEALGQALSQVVSGQMLMPLSVGRMLMSRAVESPTPAATLTSRETGVLRLLAEGLSNKQIGRRLDISEHGAKRLVGSVLAKLNTPNRTSAVVLAIKAGLL